MWHGRLAHGLSRAGRLWSSKRQRHPAPLSTTLGVGPAPSPVSSVFVDAASCRVRHGLSFLIETFHLLSRNARRMRFTSLWLARSPPEAGKPHLLACTVLGEGIGEILKSRAGARRSRGRLLTSVAGMAPGFGMAGFLWYKVSPDRCAGLRRRTPRPRHAGAMRGLTGRRLPHDGQ